MRKQRLLFRKEKKKKTKMMDILQIYLHRFSFVSTCYLPKRYNNSSTLKVSLN
uniref:Uncharacterized protein n=1 Tax=Octopus bimaculoides TaxID=37653 RepID=A0A0L8H6E1_OCTBM